VTCLVIRILKASLVGSVHLYYQITALGGRILFRLQSWALWFWTKLGCREAGVRKQWLVLLSQCKPAKRLRHIRYFQSNLKRNLIHGRVKMFKRYSTVAYSRFARV